MGDKEKDGAKTDKSKKAKTFPELAVGKGLKEATLKALEEQDYTSTEDLATLTVDEIKSFTAITMGQQGRLRKWVAELTPPPKVSAAASKAAVSKASLTIQDLRADSSLMEWVDDRIKRLGLGAAAPKADAGDSEDDDEADKTADRKKGKKSGRKRTSCDVIKKVVDWPHFHVYRGPGRKPAEFDDLSSPEFTYGHVCVMKEVGDQKEKDAMLDHLQALMADSTEYGWPAARNFHGVLLQLLEQQRFTWGQDTTKIREQYLKTASSKPDSKPEISGIGASAGGKRFCAPYQSGKCTERETEHESSWGTVHHICAFCCKKAGRACNHPESKCIRKTHMVTREDHTQGQ